MVTTTAARLLSDLDPLPYPARQEHVARLARRLAGTPELADLLTDLLARGPWEQRLSLQLASVAGDLDHVRRCLTAPGTALPMAALGPAVRLGIDAEALLDLLPTMPAAVRRVLRRALRHDRTRRLADALVGPTRARYGDHEAAALLARTSDATVAEHLPDLAYAVPSWRALARRHPARFLDHVERTLDDDPRSTWDETLMRLDAGLAVAALADPDRTLDLLERTVGHVRLTRLERVLGALARHAPARVLALLVHPRRTGATPSGQSLLRALAVLDDAELRSLARSLDEPELTRLLRVLPPSRRPSAYRSGVGDQDLAWRRLGLLDLLPAPARHAEAGRLLALVRGRAGTWGTRQLVARRPWAEAEPALRAVASAPLAEDRGLAYPLLVGAAWATRDPAVVETFLGTLGRLRNEQDPVRAPAVEALSRQRMTLLTDAAAGLLVELLTVAVQARDASPGTRHAAQRIGDHLLRAGVEGGRPRLLDAGLAVWRAAADHVPTLSPAGPAGDLPAGVATVLYAELLPRIRAEERVGGYGLLVAVARAWGRVAWSIADLQERLGRARRATPDAVAAWATELWLAPPATRDARVGVVLADDERAVGVRAVVAAVAGRRTDLLDRVLTDDWVGRSLSRGAHLVPDLAGYAGRWLPRQVERYRSLLTAVVERPGVPDWERAAALRQLGRLPGSAAVVRRHLDDPAPQLADAALEVLAWTDEPAGAVPDLLARATGDRAHVAFSALARASRFLPPDDLAGALGPVLREGRITARKQAAHLLAHGHAPGAVGLLAAETERSGQHRDVRRATASALRDLLDDEAAWTALATAAADPTTATGVLEVDPLQLPPRHRSRYAGLVLAVVASPDPVVSLTALDRSPRWVRWDATGEVAAVGGRALADVDDPGAGRWEAGQRVVVAALLAGDPASLRTAADRLLTAHDARDLTPGFDAGARDLPARHRLEGLVRGLTRATGRDPVAVDGTAGLLAARLAERDLLADLGVRLAAAAVPWDRPADVPAALQGLVALCRGQADLGAEAGGTLADGLSTRLDRLPGDLPLGWVRGLPVGRDPAAALLALPAVAAIGERTGWSEPLREVLRGLRRHPDPQVRRAAARTVTTYE